MESEKKQRKLDKECQVDTLTVEELPFSFKIKKGGTEIRLAPSVQVQSLKGAVFAHLDENAKYVTVIVYSYHNQIKPYSVILKNVFTFQRKPPDLA